MKAERKIISEAIRASTGATEAQKNAAEKAAFDLRGTPFVFNGYLMLAARGAPTTESNILAEAKKLAGANERHFARKESACQ
jgi:hypothetical protein